MYSFVLTVYATFKEINININKNRNSTFEFVIEHYIFFHKTIKNMLNTLQKNDVRLFRLVFNNNCIKEKNAAIL